MVRTNLPTCTPVDGRCTKCGRPFAADLVWQRCTVVERCVHLGAAVRGVKVVCQSGRESMADAARCEVHGRCLPAYAPQGDRLAAWRERPEASTYALCAGCDHFLARNDSLAAGVIAAPTEEN